MEALFRYYFGTIISLIRHNKQLLFTFNLIVAIIYGIGYNILNKRAGS